MLLHWLRGMSSLSPGLKNIRMDCDNFFDVGTSDKYRLSHFTFENISCTDKKMAFSADIIENTICKNANISKKE